MPFSSNNTTSSKHPKGAYLLLCTVMWEFFSYYGMKALLILYLSKKLLYSDHHAYELYGAYTSLVYITPLVGGFLADRFLGYKISTIIGSILIALGHFILVIPSAFSLYVGLACVVLGVGFFKTNSIALLGEFYPKDLSSRSNAYSLYYVGGNLGGFLSPLCCAYVAHYFGWHWGFILAGIGMLLGLITMLIGFNNFSHVGNPKATLINKTFNFSFYPAAILLLLIACIALLKFIVVGYVLLVIIAGVVVYQYKIHSKVDIDTKREFYLFYVLTILATLFWIFDQQGGSSISLFILRNIEKTITFDSIRLVIPTAAFQTINPFVILITGPIIAYIWRQCAKRSILVTNLMKFLIGLLSITIGFFFIAINAKLAIQSGQAPMTYVVIGLAFVAIAELFIDPTSLAFISKIAPEGTVSMMTGVYYLFCGAIANYLSAQLATLTDIQEKVQYLIKPEFAKAYMHLYFQIFYVGICLIVITLMFKYIFRRLYIK